MVESDGEFKKIVISVKLWELSIFIPILVLVTSWEQTGWRVNRLSLSRNRTGKKTRNGGIRERKWATLYYSCTVTPFVSYGVPKNRKRSHIEEILWPRFCLLGNVFPVSWYNNNLEEVYACNKIHLKTQAIS